MSQYQFQILRTCRENAINLIDDLSVEQVNSIPQGFNNNLAWNLGHMLVTQQLLFYGLSSAIPYVSNDVINKYRKGSKPEHTIQRDEMDWIKKNLITTIDLAIDDLAGNKFREFKPYSTSFNLELKSIGDAITFNNIHESLHFGYMMAMIKLV